MNLFETARARREPQSAFKKHSRKNAMNILRLFNAAKNVCFLAAGMSLAMAAGASPIDAAFEFDAPSFSANFGTDYNLGISFIANQDLEVDALAYYDDGPSSSAHSVALFSMAGIKLAETIVHSGDTLLDNFRYSSIAAVRLKAGEMYRIIGNSTGDNFTWNVANFFVHPLLTYSGYSYSEANGLSAQFDGDAITGTEISDAVWGPSLSVHAAGAEVPEPSSYFLMLAGMTMLVMASRRQKK